LGADIKAGLSCPVLVEKYGINHKTLRRLTDGLAETGLISEYEGWLVKKESLDCERKLEGAPRNKTGSDRKKK
jgi:hypothetical protein